MAYDARKVELYTAPAEEPVTLTEAKAHCRVDHTTDDTFIGTLIAAARAMAEEMAERAFVTQTLRCRLDAFPSLDCQDAETLERLLSPGGEAIELPRPRLQSVSSITYIDSDGATQVLASTEYTVDQYLEPGRIVPAYGKSWPATRNVPNAVVIQYVAGYGAASAVDPRAKQAVLFLLGHMYENREAVLVGTISKEIEHGARALLAQLWHGRGM